MGVKHGLHIATYQKARQVPFALPEKDLTHPSERQSDEYQYSYAIQNIWHRSHDRDASSDGLATFMAWQTPEFQNKFSMVSSLQATECVMES